MRGRGPIPQAEREAFAAAVAEGLTITQLSRRFNLHRTAVVHRERTLGLKIQRQRRMARDYPERLTFLASKEMIDALLTLSFRRGGNVSSLIRDVLQEHIDENLPLPPEQPRAQAPVPRDQRQGEVLQSPGHHNGSGP